MTGRKEGVGLLSLCGRACTPGFPGVGMNHCMKEENKTKRIKGVQGRKAGLGTLLLVLSLVPRVSLALLHGQPHGQVILEHLYQLSGVLKGAPNRMEGLGLEKARFKNRG